MIELRAAARWLISGIEKHKGPEAIERHQAHFVAVSRLRAIEIGYCRLDLAGALDAGLNMNQLSNNLRSLS